jgi:hypothetical protein
MIKGLIDNDYIVGECLSKGILEWFDIDIRWKSKAAVFSFEPDTVFGLCDGMKDQLGPVEWFEGAGPLSIQ